MLAGTMVTVRSSVPVTVWLPPLLKSMEKKMETEIERIPAANRKERMTLRFFLTFSGTATFFNSPQTISWFGN